MDYIARKDKQGRTQPLRDHILSVARTTEQLLQDWSIPPAQLGRLAGLLHDLGKYSQEFQNKLNGADAKVHHAHPGAKLARRLGILELQLAILAHHGGLQDAAPPSYVHEGAILPDPAQCLHAMEADFKSSLTLEVPKHATRRMKNLPSMLATRILLGALVCADWEDSMRFEGESYHKPPTPDWREVYQMLVRKRAQVRTISHADKEMIEARERVWEYAGALAQKDPGIYVLAAPTGTGKTMAMLRFALEHAIKHDLRRIIIATPFLSITDQWESILMSLVPSGLVFLDHSMVEDSEDEDSMDYRARNYYKAWFHPVIITTFNQLLESLFERRCSEVRKLPQLARSVILLDEFHTIPTELIEYTLRALRYISEWGGSIILLASATPPEPGVITNTHQIVSQDNPLDSSILNTSPVVTLRPRRTFHTINNLEPISILDLNNLVQEEYKHSSVCIVLNFTEDAANLASMLQLQGIDVYHLSTRMCPAHRQIKLDEIRKKLDNGERLILVSTQCIEAGVDLDFPVLFRALAPLTSIVQAAGRCNRHGKLPTGDVYLFTVDTDGEELERLKYLSQFYRQGAISIYNNIKEAKIDIQQLESIDTLMEYQRLVARQPDQGVLTGIAGYDFNAVRDSYRLIANKPKFSIIIPRYANRVVNAIDIKPSDIHGLRKAMVDVFVHGNTDILSYCEPVPRAGNVYVLLEDSLYDELTGLDPRATAFVII